MGSKRAIKTTIISRPAGMQTMGQALYEQIRQAMAELRPVKPQPVN